MVKGKIARAAQLMFNEACQLLLPAVVFLANKRKVLKSVISDFVCTSALLLANRKSLFDAISLRT